MPSSIINSDDGAISGTSGLKSSGGDDGVLNIQSNGTTVAAVSDGAFQIGGNNISAENSLGFRNRIINGDMRIDQRNAGTSSTANGVYTVDRWSFGTGVSGKMTYGQNYNSLTPPVGFTNYMGFKTTTAHTVGASEFFLFAQPIEGLNVSDLAWGSASAKTITLSFLVNSSLTGTFGGVLSNSAQNRSYPFTYTISSANTWETKTVTIAGDTTGTWLTTNGVGIHLYFGLGVGSTFNGTAGAWAGATYLGATGATSVVGTLNATWNITGVQLEVGSVATPFERRPYGTELSLCYRYAWNYSSALSSNGSYLRYLSTRNTNTTGVAGTLIFPVEMRTTPSLTTTGTASNYAVTHTGGNTACSTVPAIGGDGSSRFQVNLEATVASGLTSGQGSQLMSNNNQTSFLLFSAEL